MKTIISLALLLIAQTSFAAPEVFYMYSEPGHKPNPECDVRVKLLLDTSTNPVRVGLINELAGRCEILVRPNPRSYAMTVVDRSCGSIYYRLSDGNDDVTLVDHRQRRCRDLQPAQIILNENRNGAIRTLYSLDR